MDRSERPRDRDALFHAARQLGRIVIAKVRQPDLGEQAVRHRRRSCAALTLHLEAPGDVLLDGAPGIEGEFLEHDAAVRARGGDRLAVEQELPFA